MNDIVSQTLEKYSMLSPEDSVIVALSGGADSAALLGVMCSLREKYRLTVYAAHLNHMLRGGEADRDENFCVRLCDSFSVKLFVKRADIRRLAAERKISEELCGRNERYSFFEELSEKLSAKIATAHTASDNAETLIYNIARGSSVRGLSAIPPVRGKIIRPLIACTREMTEEYCRNSGISYVTDSSNLTDDYTRNKIRHRVIPRLREINPSVEEAVLRLSGDAAELTALLDDMTDEALERCSEKYGYSCKKMLSLNPAVLKNMIFRICRDSGFSPEHRHIALALGIIKTGGAVELDKSRSLTARQGIFRLVRTEDKVEFAPLPLAENMSFDYMGRTYRVSPADAGCESENSVSADFSAKGAVFRRRMASDSFACPRRGITKPLRKLMGEMKIPAEKRDSLLLLALGSTVLWCEGIGASDSAKGGGSRRLLISSADRRG